MPAVFAIPLAVIAVLLVLFTFPVSLPLIALLNALDRRRLRVAAAAADCVRCGHRLGPEALGAADEAWMAEMADMHRRYPHGTVRVVRRIHAVCTSCGARYGWDERDRALELLPEDPRPPQEQGPDEARPDGVRL